MSGDYIDVNGVKSYYEVHGAGEPLVLMHGGFCTVEVLSSLTDELAPHFRVYIPERRGHGRTPDVEGPYDYDVMAADTIGFIEAAGIGSANLVGFSDGANAALVTAIQRPDLVRSLVSLGGNYDCDGIAPQFAAYMDSATPETFIPELAGAYKKLSPDGADHFPVVFEKIIRMWKNEPKLTTEDLARIAAPSLIVSADRDVVTLEHTVEMFRAILKAQLYVAPGTNHMSLVGKHAPVIAAEILRFLAA